MLQHRDHGSVTLWLGQLREGDTEAAEKIWARYFDRLVTLAERRFDPRFRKAADEEDVALSVLDTVIRGSKSGRFQFLRDRQDLWCLLIAITRQKIADVRRHETRRKRGGGRTLTSSELGDTSRGQSTWSLDEMLGETPSPEFLVSLEEQKQRLYSLLRDRQLEEIAELTLQGYGSEEIAERYGRSARTIRRKLALIRSLWIDAFASE